MFRLLPPALVMLLALPAAASSDDAWEAFRAEVDSACRALVTGPGAPSVEVEPFGSASYGVALITMALPDGASERYACVFDKESKAAELAGPFPEAEAAPESE
ncbi:hypothetical protein GVY41_19260 [Frigidibacter albus]|uniref:Uncharacterized protein n=1 Tax=Frigidibacter albus TaxID=1465486 RepID=A0A6L8VN23_9RHOB|nr:hypothetical protein [Frigidibacter albus]MZQ91211.1 hypothetical protein [Frigidibacter albus]NBE33138.1 hypothetical protein [Frigidibacter albus]GGH63548.1 hypothetical protein GCM10011341_38760 [Frigidibacter albus]